MNRPSEEDKEKIRKEAKDLLSGKFSHKSGNTAAAFKAGRRADHDTLPEEIQSLYRKNLELRHSMQQLHLQIRNLLKSRKDCAPQDLKDLCALLKKQDTEYRLNWKKYDDYGKE